MSGFTIENAVLIRYSGTEDEVTVPETVQRIGTGAFADCENVKKIILPDGILGVSEDAFNGCSPDLSVEFNWAQFNKLSKKAKEAMTFLWLKGMDIFSKRQIEGIKKGIIKRKKDYFWTIKWGGSDFGAWNRSNVYQESVAISKFSAQETLPLEDVSILSRFLSCEEFTEEEIDAFIESVNDGNHISIMSALLEYKNEHFNTYPGNNMRVDFENAEEEPFETIKINWKFTKDNKLGGYKITGYLGNDPHPNVPAKIKGVDVVAIGNEAFANQYFIGIELPDTIHSIGAGAFKNCSKLIEIDLPDKIKDLPKSLFSDCKELKKVKLPAELETIASSTFIKGCSNGGENETVNRNLQEISISADNPAFGTVDGVLYEKASGKILHFPAKKQQFAIPQYVTDIPMGTFACTELSGIEFNKEVLSIGSYAFYKCQNLRQIDFPDGKLKTIGKYAFENCTELTHVHLPSGLTKIEDQAFCECTKLTEIYIPAKVKTIGEFCFNKNIIIHAASGSYAEQYAKDNGLQFVAE